MYGFGMEHAFRAIIYHNPEVFLHDFFYGWNDSRCRALKPPNRTPLPVDYIGSYSEQY